jgi:hypothetical protein
MIIAAEHVRRDLNPQQAVLETAALPIELLTFVFAEKRGADGNIRPARISAR